MARGRDIVEIGIDALAERERRRRALLRIGVPVGGVAVLIAAILAIALYAHGANRAGAIALSADVLVQLEKRIALAVNAYLDPTERAVRVLRDVVGTAATDEDSALAETVATSLLKEIPQISLISYADEDGNYTYVRRAPGGGTEIKIIRNAPQARRVTIVERGADGRELRRRNDPADEFDPRTRPWYTAAIDAREPRWTGVYVFFTEKTPGVTVSIGHAAPNGRRYVFGMDIALAAMSGFLSSLEIARTGKAIIVDERGRLIAAPTGIATSRAENGTLVSANVADLGDPALVGAYDRMRVEGAGRHVVDIGGRRYLWVAAALPATERRWSVLIVAPEDEFVGFTSRNNRRVLAMSLVVVGIAAALAMLLMRQGLRGDRATRLLLHRQRAINRQSTAFAELARDASQFDAASDEAPRTLTETLARAGAARRASIWRLDENGQRLRCEDSFDSESAGHTDGAELHRDELPRFFAAIVAGETLEVADAARDSRTAELHRLLLEPLGGKSLLAVPVMREGRAVGSIWIENAAPSEGARDFAHAVANMIAGRMRRSRMVETAAAPSEPDAAAPALPVPALSAGADLVVAETRPSAQPITFDRASALVLQLTDTASPAIVDAVAGGFQELAGRHGIPYLKIAGDTLVAAAGLGEGGADAPVGLAQAAIALREQCAALFAERHSAPNFRLGMDCGPAVGAEIGREPRVFNLCGDALTGAEAMARSAPLGTVHVSEAAYGRLRHAFLFRPRGTFYFPRSGAARTFVLGGKL